MILAGLELRTNELLTIGPFEDWSGCRSPSRAKRRQRQGHRQRVRYFYKPDPKVYQIQNLGGTMGVLVCHPATAQALIEAIPKWETVMDRRPRPFNHMPPIGEMFRNPAETYKKPGFEA